MSARRFLAEGPQAVREALAYTGPGGPCVREVFATADAEDRYADLRDAARAVDADWLLVEDAAIDGLADTVSPAGSGRGLRLPSTSRCPTRSTRRRRWSRSAPTSATRATPAP